MMNKDVIHDGELHKKGSELKPRAKGFKTLVQGGHADAVGFDSEVEAPKELKIEEPIFKRKNK